MLSTARTVTSLIAGATLAVLGNGLLGTAVALRAADGFSATAAALVLASYYAGLCLGPWLISALIARIGHIRVFAASAAASSGSFLLLGLWVHPAGWMPLRAVAGLSMAGMFIVLESWLHAKATPENRGALLAVYMSAAQLALAGGQLLLFVFPPSDARVFILGALLHAFALIPIALTFIEQPAAPSTERFGVLRLLAVAPLGVIGCLASGIIVGTILTLAPIYVVALGHDVGDAAVFMVAMTAAGLAPQWMIGKLSDRIGRRPVLAAVGVGLALASVALTFGAQLSYGGLLGLAAAVGLLAFLVYPLSTAYANDLVEPERIVAVSGTLIVTFAVGALFGPLLGSAAAEILGVAGPFYLVAAVGLLLTVACVYRLIVRRPIPRSEWTHYAPLGLPQAAPGGELQPDAPWPDEESP